MGKVSKQFKKFASSGKLKDTIKTRRKNQQIKRKSDARIEQRKHQRGAPREEGEERDDEDDEDDERSRAKDLKGVNSAVGGRAGGVAKTVDELFGIGGLDAPAGEDSDLEDLDDEEEEEDEDEEGEDEEGDLLDEKAMKKAMKDLEKTDPEFFKYLKENDQELLDFEAQPAGSKGKAKKVDQDDEDEEMDSDDDEDEDEEDEDEDEVRKISVTMRMLRLWQEGMLKQHSIRSLRKTLLAFRAAAHMNEDDADQGSGRDTKYSIDSANVFNKLVLTALKFTPVVLSHHMPYKTLANGKIRVSQQKKPNQSLNRLVLSHFSTLLHMIRSLPSGSSVSPSSDDSALLVTALQESTKLLPWILGARKHLRAYLKVLLELWSSAGDNVRIAAFLAVRKTYVAGDDALKDSCLKNTYKALLPPLRHTTPHSLPSINLTKNTAAELFALDPTRSYPHAFGFIRQLAIHLRSVVRSTTSAPSAKTTGADGAKREKKGGSGGMDGEIGEAFRVVYNWQYIHTVDFWSQVLSKSCDVKEGGDGESELKPLIYPLTQIALGVIRLLPSSRYFPLRFHLLHSLIRMVQRTDTYIPLTPFLLEILDSAEFKRSSRPKKTTLKPVDLEYVIRVPAAYQKTKIFQETLSDEITFLLGDYHRVISGYIAFPEIVLPTIITLRRFVKKANVGTGPKGRQSGVSPKVLNSIKVLVDKLEATKTWCEGKRKNVGFAPRDRSELVRYRDRINEDESPVGSWIKVQRKQRDARRIEVEKALREEQPDEEDEEDEDDDEDAEMSFDEEELESDDE